MAEERDANGKYLVPAISACACLVACLGLAFGLTSAAEARLSSRIEATMTLTQDQGARLAASEADLRALKDRVLPALTDINTKLDMLIGWKKP